MKNKGLITFLLFTIIIIFVLNSNNQKSEIFATQSLCDTCGDGIIHICDVKECLQLGCVYDPSGIGMKCLSCLQSGVTIYNTAFVKDYPEIYPTKMCCSGNYKTYKGTFGDSGWMCVPQDSPIGDKCGGEGFKKTISNMVKSIFKNVDCEEAFFIGIGIGIILLLFLISSL